MKQHNQIGKYIKKQDKLDAQKAEHLSHQTIMNTRLTITIKKVKNTFT